MVMMSNDKRAPTLPGSRERSDAEIARALRYSLEWDVLVPHERIRTIVSKGVVILEGTVDCLSQYDDASRCARTLAGVHDVDNRIVVQPLLPRLTPLAIRSAVEQALERHSDDAPRRVQVAVTGGRVTLSGEVPSSWERILVEEAVRATRGVLGVDNQLRVQVQR
jgi:osmotically-inducible protein OsmY